MKQLWPRSLKGQVLLAIALALLLGQTIHSVLLYRAIAERTEATVVRNLAMNLFRANRNFSALPPASPQNPPAAPHPTPPQAEQFNGPRSELIERLATSPVRAGERRFHWAEEELRDILAEQNVEVSDVVVVQRRIVDDPRMQHRLAHRAQMLGQPPEAVAHNLALAAIKLKGAHEWLVARSPLPAYENTLLLSLIAQTLLIYLVLVGAMALVLGRITRPLASLTQRMQYFAETRDTSGQIAAEGPDDLRLLITAHNGLEARIAALIDEKDVMLGAIGHDLKTPLASLRIRIESITDDAERGKMAATIDETVRVLDDILHLARVGRAGDPVEPVELSALLAAVVEEYEDMGEPVTLADTQRTVAPCRSVWLRRALRNLIGNAVRYGKVARVELSSTDNSAIIRIEDDGPGIADSEMAAMMEPFKRGDPSRNSATGGSGLGLTLARAIAEQHGGTLKLENRRDKQGAVAGLTAELRLPLERDDFRLGRRQRPEGGNQASTKSSATRLRRAGLEHDEFDSI